MTKRKAAPEPARRRRPRLDTVRLVKKLMEKVTPMAQRYRSVAEVNERFVNGDQWTAMTWKDGARSRSKGDSWFEDEGVPRIHVNHLRNLEITLSSLLVKDRQSAKSVAASEKPEDVFDAEYINRVIDFFVYELDTKNKIHRTVRYAGQHGTSGIKILVNPDTGDISWAPLTIFNYVRDPTPDYKKARWVIFTNYLDETEAQDLFDKKGVDKKPKSTKFKNAANDSLEGVEQVELWLKPNGEHPEGLFASIIDGELVEEMPFPNVFTPESAGAKSDLRLPFVEMKMRDVRDSAYGSTPLTDCVPLQRSHNECVSRLVKAMRAGTNLVLLLPKELQDTYRPGIDVVAWFNQARAAPGAREAKWLQPPIISEVIYNLRDFFEASMTKVIGLNQITAGIEQHALSGRAQQQRVELDSQKNADATKEIEAMVVDAFGLTLCYAQKNYTTPRKMEIIDGDQLDVLLFDRTNIQGARLRLEAASEHDKDQDARDEATIEGQQTGLTTPRDMQRLTNRPGYDISRASAEEVVTNFLAGQNVDLQADDIDPAIFSEVIARAKARAISQAKKTDWIALAALERQFRSMGPAAGDLAPGASSSTSPEPVGAPPAA